MSQLAFINNYKRRPSLRNPLFLNHILLLILLNPPFPVLLSIIYFPIALFLSFSSSPSPSPSSSSDSSNSSSFSSFPFPPPLSCFHRHSTLFLLLQLLFASSGFVLILCSSSSLYFSQPLRRSPFLFLL